MNDLFKIDFLTEINYLRIFIDIIILFVCSMLIEKTYEKFSFSNDNKSLFSRHMFPFVLAMFLIVSVIKTSIALSLGLVGALSIIRFRTAIKEPGQLITLLILTSLSISLAAEKEILGIIITIIYSAHTFFQYNNHKKNKTSYDSKILRVSLKDVNLSLDELMDSKFFDRIYKDINGLIHIEFRLNALQDAKNIISDFKKEGSFIGYEII